MEGSLYIWYISRKEGECMKNNEALITYVELSLKECDAYAIKWHEKDLHNVAIRFEGMSEAYSDILKILKGVKII